jgi:cyclic pyranopterin phosphate synthase
MNTSESIQAFPAVAATAAAPTHVYWGGDNLYVNLTSRCSSSCSFCLRESSWELFGVDLHLDPDDEPTAAEVIECIRTQEHEPREVVFTGLGEPTLRLDHLLEIVRWLSGRGVASRLDTNGQAQLLNPGRKVVAELAAAGLDRLSVSLNAADIESYDRLCRPQHAASFVAVTHFIRDSVQAGLDTTATMVGVPGLQVEAVAELAGVLGARFRVRPYVPPEE